MACCCGVTGVCYSCYIDGSSPPASVRLTVSIGAPYSDASGVYDLSFTGGAPTGISYGGTTVETLPGGRVRIAGVFCPAGFSGWIWQVGVYPSMAAYLANVNNYLYVVDDGSYAFASQVVHDLCLDIDWTGELNIHDTVGTPEHGWPATASLVRLT